jgi:transmembrane sensor
MTSAALPPDWDAIARFLAGESTAEEASVVRAWLAANPRDQELVERLSEPSAAFAPADLDVDAALERVHARMTEADRPALTLSRGAPGHRNEKRRRIIVIGGFMAAAAAFISVSLRRDTPTVQAPAVRTYATGVGKRDSVLLPDGSHVTLGPQSRLVVPSDYGRTTRHVELTGDAYFDVRHDAAKPFSVRSAQALIEEVGTTFTVESDAGAMTSVSVLTGSVRLRNESSAAADGVVLSAGDRGSLQASGQANVARHVVEADDAAWVSGRLVFRDAPLSRVAAEIQRWYGVSVQASDTALLSRHVTTTITGEPIDQVLKILGLALDARIDRRGDSAFVLSHHGPAAAR